LVRVIGADRDPEAGLAEQQLHSVPRGQMVVDDEHLAPAGLHERLLPTRQDRIERYIYRKMGMRETPSLVDINPG
jgi:hypothetical protein